MKKIIYRQKPTVRLPRMYLNRNRICCKCGSNRTDDRMINRVLWHRDNDDYGKWTGRWKCHKCYMKDYQKRRMKKADTILQELLEKIDVNTKLNNEKDIIPTSILTEDKTGSNPIRGVVS